MPFVKWGMKTNDTLCAMIAGANGYRDEDGIWRGESRHHAAFRIRFAETRRERDGRNQLQEEDNDMERRKDEGDARGGLSREDKVGQSKRMGSGYPPSRRRASRSEVATVVSHAREERTGRRRFAVLVSPNEG